ncbi:MAG: esterase, partial [Flavobacteriaceae bacterium]|nr:esterase [Flavobacteriaceae bacterium]
MKSTEKEVQYTITNTYSTLNKLTDKTKNVWFVCHGLGYLSRYFIKYFELLNAEENYIIAPQASAKQYLHGKFTHVGAGWLTKENTQLDMHNVMANFDAILATENIPTDLNFIVMGFSQGVSVATRWLAKRQIPCKQLILYAGKVPREFTPKDFDHVERVQLF